MAIRKEVGREKRTEKRRNCWGKREGKKIVYKFINKGLKWKKGGHPPLGFHSYDVMLNAIFNCHVNSITFYSIISSESLFIQFSY